MDIGIISSRYAKALLSYATERGDAVEVYRAMAVLSKSYLQVPALRDVLNDPVLPDDKKLAVLITASGETNSDSIKRFYQLVLRNHRISYIQFIANSLIQAYRKQEGVTYSHLVTSTTLDDHTIQRLKDIVKAQTKSKVEFELEQDPSLIGGFILEYDTYRFDGSVRGQLQRIKKQLVQAKE